MIRFWIEREWEYDSFTCRVVACSGGWRCGYVGLPRHHPLFEISCEDDRLDTIEVHCGLTFSNHMYDNESIWWLGFDCHHSGDALDQDLTERILEPWEKEGNRWTTAAVAAECQNLAYQLGGLKIQP